MAALRAIKFGPPIAANLRRRRSPPTGRWRLDEMVVQIRGWRMYLWRAVDDEGEVLDVLVQGRRKRRAALKRLRRLLKNQGVHPRASSRTSWPRIAPRYGPRSRRPPSPGRNAGNRAESAHLAIRRRERKQQKFKSQGSAQRFLSSHATICNTFNTQTHLIRRATLRHLRAEAHRAWAAATISA